MAAKPTAATLAKANGRSRHLLVRWSPGSAGRTKETAFRCSFGGGGPWVAGEWILSSSWHTRRRLMGQAAVPHARTLKSTTTKGLLETESPKKPIIRKRISAAARNLFQFQHSTKTHRGKTRNETPHRDESSL